MEQNTQCQIKRENGVLTVKLQGELDHYSVAAIREEIDANLCDCAGKALILDLGAVDFMDSSGLGLILGRQNKLRAIGARLILQEPTPQIERILRLAGVDRTIQMRRTSGNPTTSARMQCGTSVPRKGSTKL